MNSSKARDYFSEYYEGSLDAGIRQQFELALNNDSELKSEYSEFVAALAMVDSLTDEDVEVPFDLADKISARIDKHIWETKQTAKAGLFSNWRMALIGGLGVVAIGAAFVAMQPNTGSQTPASLVGSGSAKRTEQVDLSYRDGKVRLIVPAGFEANLVVRDLDTGATVQSVELKSRSLDAPIQNSKPDAAVLVVSLAPRSESLTVVIPGTTDQADKVGEGNPAAYAKAVAQIFRTPVLMRVKDNEKTITWNFEDVARPQDLPAGLKDQGLTLSERTDGFLVLAD